MIKKLIILLLNTLSIYSQNCNTNSGFTWCESSKKCLRELYEPCLPITKQCAYCILSHYGDDISCGDGCTLDMIKNMANNGFLGTDSDGCSSGLNAVWCENLNRCIDSNEVCPSDDNQFTQCIEYDCPILCPTGYIMDENGCNTCTCDVVDNNDNHICPLKPQNCDNDLVCPRITEITHCSRGGINGYTTYQLSLIINKSRGIKNIYALFGDSQDIPVDGTTMSIPPAYQAPSGIFNSNFGGINPQLINLNMLSEYDSWLTIGITDGDTNNQLSSIGIDFSSWTTDNGLEVTNGAIFVLDPREQIVTGNEYVIARLTIPTEGHQTATFNVQGEQLNKGINNKDNIWMQRSIVFDLQRDSNGH
jgi:hypothetical protein